MRLVHRTLLGASLALAALAFAPAAHANGILYVGDLLSNSLHRFDDITGALIPPDPFIAGVTEGVEGTNNTILCTANGASQISRYDRTTGAFINNVATGFSGIGGTALTVDAQFMYVPEENSSELNRLRISDGVIVNTVSLNAAHDAVISPDGQFVYAAGYTGSTGIVKYNADLSGATPFISFGDNGLTRPTGMTFDSSGNLWVMQNTTSGDGFVFQYDSAGNFIKKIQSPGLRFGFGIDFGPDDRLYAAILGSFVTPGYVNCIAAIDTTTDAVTSFIAVPDGGLVGPKYIRFSQNFAPVPDPGLDVPEPGAVVFGVLAAGSVLGLIARKRKLA